MTSESAATKSEQEPERAPDSPDTEPLWAAWFRRKISLALTLTALVPLLILAYSL